MSKELYKDELGLITRENGYILIRRNGSAPLNPKVLLALAEHFRLLIPLRERKFIGLLIDMREAPILTDDSFAKEVHLAVRELTVGFARSAFLVRTALGLLQISRRSRENQTEVRVFDDEQKAIAYVQGKNAIDERK